MLNYDDLKVGDEVTIKIWMNQADKEIRTIIIQLTGKRARKLQVAYSRLWYTEDDLNKYVLK